jgi:IPT/TIG domain
MFKRFPSLAVGAGLFLVLAAGACEQKGGPVNVDRVEPGTGTTMGGDLITIVGSGFEPGKTQADVLFGRRKAENIIIASSTTINVVTPAGERGPIDVSVMFHDGKAFKIANGFKYIPPADQSAAREAWEKQGAKK